MTKLKHTAHIKQPHHSSPQKAGVRTSKQLTAIVVMPKYKRGPKMGTSEWKAWNKLPITIEREEKKKDVPETDGDMLKRANDEMMKHHVDSTWLMFKHKSKVHQLYKTQ